MSPTSKRLAGAASAVLLVASAGAGTVALEAAHARERHDRLVEAADGSSARAQDAVHAQLSAVEGRAVSAASIPVLRAQLGVVDAATLRDGFSTEPWWEPVRRDFSIYGIAAGDAPDLLVGADGTGLDFAALVRAARKERQASSVIASADAAVLAGGAVAEASRRGTPFVVLLAKPLDGGFLDEVASRTRGAALLSDGKRVLLSGGPAAEQERLKQAIGSEGARLFEGEDWAGAAAQLSPGLWLWTYARPRGVAAKTPVDLLALWAIALLGALVSLVVAFRSGAGVPEPEAVTEQTEAPAGFRARSDPGRTVRSDPGRTVRSDPGRKTGRSDPGRKTARTDPGADRSEAGPVARPKQFGRYYLVDRIGEGGMAEIYTAVAFGAESFRRTFVIKLLHGSAQRTEGLVEMFIDEAKLASNLIHSNIIPVYDFGKMGEEYFMAQEYVLGRDLRRLTTRRVEVEQKPLGPRLAVYIAREALRALEYAHTRQTDDGRPLGIVHRDVSPNNILVSARGEVKLFDFGIAKAAEGRLHQTQTGVVKGNVQFMSPEQARGEAVDARADVCSMGLVLYFLLAGRSLYQGDSAYAFLVQAATGLSSELLPKLEKLPPPLAAVLRVALEPDREQRFQSAAAFENALSQMPTGSGAELAIEMQRLFGDELKAEQARFLSIEPPPDEPPEGEEPGEAPGSEQTG
jgi:hypothetical protein